MAAPARAPRRAPARPAPRPRPRKAKTAERRVSGSGNVVMMPVNAVGRTAVAVGGIADSGFVMGMSRSRAWIVVLGLLLGGIVAVNVVGLSLSAAGSRTSAKIDELVRDNSVMRSRIANRLSNERITAEATALGLAIPAPDAVHYLDSSASDAEQAAKRLTDGSIANAAPATMPVETEVVPVEPAAMTTDPAVVPVDPALATEAEPVPEAIP